MNSQNRPTAWLKYGGLVVLGGIVSASLYGAGDPSCGALALWRLIGKLTD